MPVESGSRIRCPPETSADIVFSPDILGYRALISRPTSEIEPSDAHAGAHSLEPPPAAKQKPSEGRAAVQQPVGSGQRALIHPLLRGHYKSGRAGDITPLDHHIAEWGGTTSTYEELPHRLKLSKKHQPLTSEERVIELTYEKSFLLQELAYYKETRAAEMKFLEQVTKLRAEMRVILAQFDCALNERSRKRARAESDLCSYWGIDFGDGNVEDIVF